MAVRLTLPPCAKLHDVLHVGLLKKWVGEPPAAPPPLPVIHNVAVEPEPERVVRARLARGVRQVLIQWKGEPAASATWEDLDSFRDKHPAFQLEDELLVEGGGEMSCGAAPILGNGVPETSVALLNARLAHSRRPQAMRSRLARNRKRDQISS